MLDERETRESREDARTAAESLFGDAAADPAVAVAEEQEAKNEIGQERQSTDAAEEQAGPPDDLKVVVSIKEGRATIGVQRPSSDPHIEPVDAPDLSGLVREVLAVVERARARWEDAPRHPAFARPAPSSGRRARHERRSAKASAVEEGAVQDQPQTQTLRLF